MPKRHHALLRLIGALGLLLVSASIIWPVVDIRVGKLWLNTSCLALGVCAVAMPIGTFLAVGIAKTNFPGRGIAA